MPWPLPSPALVSQQAVRRLPRWVVLLLCAAYVLAGFVGRAPWREVDMETLGLARALAGGESSWLMPALQGGALLPEAPGVLQTWLGAWFLMLIPESWAWAEDFVVRLPFMGLLVLCLVSLWWAAHGLARLPSAQPVAFAFGGQASPKDYACALADGALLALLACLGLAQMGHEASHSLVQLFGVCSLLYALSAMGWQPRRASVAVLIGQLSLALSGGVFLGLGMGALAVMLALFSPTNNRWIAGSQRYSWAAWWGLCALACAVGVRGVGVASEAAWLELGLMRLADWDSFTRLLVWFSWPSWPFALWTLWRWRAQLRRLGRGEHLHLLIPLWLWGLALLASVFSPERERSLLLSLPAIALLAAFALPTLQRSLGAFIDWLTLIFFTASALTIWIVWLSVQTGFPAKPAANVARLADGYQPPFEFLPFMAALLASGAWMALVLWRTRRHRAAIWKTLAMPAGGTVLGWVLLMTLWLPMLDYGRSYTAQAQRLVSLVPNNQTCVYTYGFNAAQVSAISWYTGWDLSPYGNNAQCSILLMAQEEGLQGVPISKVPEISEISEIAKSWEILGVANRPTDSSGRDGWRVYRPQAQK